MITGYVVDATTGEAMPGASVRAGREPAGQLAGADGSFSFRAAKGDTLRASFVGYEGAVLIIQQCETTVLLRPVATAIDEVVVEGERLISEEFAIRKLSKLEVYTNPSAKADPVLAVNSMPFATTTDESANISLRGGSPAETGVFLNDVPIEDAVRYSQLSGIGTFSIFNTALIDEVQVYPGNPPLEFGNSTSGVIALYTDEQVPARSNTQLSATLASLGAYHARKLCKKSSVTLFGNIQSSAVFNQLNARALRDLKGFFSMDLGAHFVTRLSPTLYLKLFNYSLRESYRYRYAHPTQEGIFSQDRTRNFTVANLRKQWRDLSLTLNQGLSFSTATYNFSSLDVDVRAQDYYAALNLHRSARLYQWKTGLVYQYKQNGTEGTYPAYPYAYGKQFGTVPVNNRGHRGLWEGFAYYKRYVGNAVTLGAGVRKNLPDDEVNYFNWQANANVRPGRRWSVNLSAGDYSKYVLARDRSVKSFVLNSRQYSLDVNLLNRKLDFATSFYHKHIYRGIRREVLYGAEIYGRYRFDNSWRTQLSLSSLSARDDKGTATAYNINYFLRGNVEYKLQGTWTFTLVFLLRQGSYYYPVESTVFHESPEVFEPVYASNPSRLPAYNTLDFSASRIFMVNDRTTAIAFFNVANVADFKNVRGYLYNYDYTNQSAQLFSRRVVYFGIVFNF